MLILGCKGFSQLSLKNLQLSCYSEIATKASFLFFQVKVVLIMQLKEPREISSSKDIFDAKSVQMIHENENTKTFRTKFIEKVEISGNWVKFTG